MDQRLHKKDNYKYTNLIFDQNGHQNIHALISQYLIDLETISWCLHLRDQGLHKRQLQYNLIFFTSIVMAKKISNSHRNKSWCSNIHFQDQDKKLGRTITNTYLNDPINVCLSVLLIYLQIIIKLLQAEIGSIKKVIFASSFISSLQLDDMAERLKLIRQNGKMGVIYNITKLSLNKLTREKQH